MNSRDLVKIITMWRYSRLPKLQRSLVHPVIGRDYPDNRLHRHHRHHGYHRHQCHRWMVCNASATLVPFLQKRHGSPRRLPLLCACADWKTPSLEAEADAGNPPEARGDMSKARDATDLWLSLSQHALHLQVCGRTPWRSCALRAFCAAIASTKGALMAGEECSCSDGSSQVSLHFPASTSKRCSP